MGQLVIIVVVKCIGVHNANLTSIYETIRRENNVYIVDIEYCLVR